MSIKNKRIYCGFVTKKMIGKKIKLFGWINKIRDHGGLIFIDLRDITGILQIVFDKNLEIFKKIENLRNEYVLEINGILKERNFKSINKNIKTGNFELLGEDIKILNISKTPVFEIKDDISIDENIRLKYRYLDLRRPIMKKNILTRHKLLMIIRNFLDKKNFIEIETPILGKSTPEGARDYLVPSRIYPGSFFALPQSPQQYKQILMISGFEKYFQIARCFRDEDLRADRQPEFTQLDIEMSFVEKNDLISLTNEMIRFIFKKILNISLEKKIKTIKYEEAINRFGTDHPDTRFDLELKDITFIFKNTSFNIFKKIIKNRGIIKGMNLKKVNNKISKKDINKFIEFVKKYNLNGLSYIEINNNKTTSSIMKFLSNEEICSIKKLMNAENGDLLIITAGDKNSVNNCLSSLRLLLGKKLNLIDNNKFNFVWIVDFPLFKYDKENKKLNSVHHMFTSPKLEDIEILNKNPLLAKSLAYDLVLNGTELGGGSIRINNRKIQQKIFDLLGFSKSEAEKQFGFLLEAFRYGTPPHGGIAFGIDRIMMIIAKCKNIRDVIAFPKTQSTFDLMSNAPSKVIKEQLKELSIKEDFLKK